jgi:hypothetical protein
MKATAQRADEALVVRIGVTVREHSVAIYQPNEPALCRDALRRPGLRDPRPPHASHEHPRATKCPDCLKFPQDVLRRMRHVDNDDVGGRAEFADRCRHSGSATLTTISRGQKTFRASWTSLAAVAAISRSESMLLAVYRRARLWSQSRHPPRATGSPATAITATAVASTASPTVASVTSPPIAQNTNNGTGLQRRSQQRKPRMQSHAPEYPCQVQ